MHRASARPWSAPFKLASDISARCTATVVGVKAATPSDARWSENRRRSDRNLPQDQNHKVDEEGERMATGDKQGFSHQSVTQLHKALHEFVGEWKVSQKIWTSPDAKPVTHHGKTKCTELLGGLATLMVTEMESSSFKGVALMTYNPGASRYDLAWLDTMAGNGVGMMQGEQKRGPSDARLQAEFGRSATQVREWRTSSEQCPCLPGDVLTTAAQFASAAGGSPLASTAVEAPRAAIADIPLRMLEHKISDNQWVLEFFVPGPGGSSFLAQQNTFTRVGR